MRVGSAVLKAIGRWKAAVELLEVWSLVPLFSRFAGGSWLEAFTWHTITCFPFKAIGFEQVMHTSKTGCFPAKMHCFVSQAWM